MGRNIVRWSAALALIPGLLACGESTGPTGELAEVYRLVEVAGDPLPATIEEAPGFFRTWVSDVILIYDDERWERTQELRFRPAGGDEQEQNWITEGSLVREGDGAILSFECNDTGLCVAPDRLRFVPDGAVIEREITADSVLVWRYELSATTASP